MNLGECPLQGPFGPEKQSLRPPHIEGAGEINTQTHSPPSLILLNLNLIFSTYQLCGLG